MSKRLRIIIASALIVVIAAALLMLLRVTPPDQERAEQMLSELLSAESYRFTIAARVTVNGAERDYFTLYGEKIPDAAHLVGTVLGTETELYFVGNTLYQSDNNGSWQTIDLDGIDQAAALFAELTPAEAFAHSGLSGYEYLGLVDTAEGRRMQLVLYPEATGWVAEYFRDISYTITCDKRGRRIENVALHAIVKDNPEAGLLLTAAFYDQGKNIVIATP